MPSLPPVAPAFSLLCCPHPPDPLPLWGRGRPRLFHARGFAPCIPSIRPPAALTDPAEAAPCGVACLLCRLPILPLACFVAPIPPTRARRALCPSGEGGDQGYFMQGASPLASPALNRLRHLQTLPKRHPVGGLPSLSPAYPLPLACFIAPIPPTPFPAGRGRPRLFHARGFTPCIPGLDGDAALALLVENQFFRC